MSGRPPTTESPDPLDDRLRAEVRHRVAAAPKAPTWDEITATRVPPRRAPLVLAAVVFVVIAALGVVLAGRGDEQTLGPPVDDGAGPARAQLFQRGSAPLSATDFIVPGGNSNRHGATGVWTGTQYIVWGGAGDDGVVRNDGFVVLPNGRTEMGAAPIAARRDAYSVWTGTEMIVWGGSPGGDGSSDGHLLDGAAWNPTTQTWRELPAPPQVGLHLQPVGVAFAEGRFVVGLGSLNFSDSDPTALVLDLAAGTWRTVGRGGVDAIAVVGNQLVALRTGHRAPGDTNVDVFTEDLAGSRPTTWTRLPVAGPPTSWPWPPMGATPSSSPAASSTARRSPRSCPPRTAGSRSCRARSATARPAPTGRAPRAAPRSSSPRGGCCWPSTKASCSSTSGRAARRRSPPTRRNASRPTGRRCGMARASCAWAATSTAPADPRDRPRASPSVRSRRPPGFPGGSLGRWPAV